MHLLLALLTEDFSQSKWADQEVGVAIGRGVHVIPVRMGKDLYGFMERYQAISGSLESSDIENELLAYAFDEDSLEDVAIDSFILAVRNSDSYKCSRQLATYLPKIRQLNSAQEAALVEAYNGNRQVHEAYDWQRISDHLRDGPETVMGSMDISYIRPF